MMMLVSMLVFTSALAASLAVIATSVAPQWRRILRLAAGHPEAPFSPLAHLATVERRIAVRRWASDPVPAPLARLRAAA